MEIGMNIGVRKERGKLKGNWSVNVGKASISDVETEQELGRDMGSGNWKGNKYWPLEKVWRKLGRGNLMFFNSGCKPTHPIQGRLNNLARPGHGTVYIHICMYTDM
jgi:hypothetical protein